MSSYEQILSVAREAPLAVPEFERIASASEHERARANSENEDARARGRRWLLLAAAAWIAMAPLWTIRTCLEWTLGGVLLDGLWGLASYAVPALLLVWGARASRSPRFRDAVLTRGIAASNLVMGMLGALFSSWPEFVAVSMVLMLASGRSLQVLGAIGLDGSGDPQSEFAPVRHRGVLTLALILACTDVTMLLYNGGVMLVYAVWGLAEHEPKPDIWLFVSLTAGTTVLMVVNIWGLARLRTWALFSNMFTNVALVALLGVLMAPFFLVWMAVTAGIQLLLPVPILAAALGHPLPDRHDRVLTVLLRFVVPAMMLATIVAGILPIEHGLLWWW